MSQGREAIVKRGPGRPPRHSYAPFAFKTGDLVLVKWNDGMVYFAKIKRIDHKRQKCVVVFDDKSQDEAHFSQIHSVDETTTDIICIRCKKDDSDKPNEIVLCDTCGIGFHQKCHHPNIPASALELSTPWNCTYCQKGEKCPFLTESLDVLQNLLSDDECSAADDGIDTAAGFDSDHYEPDVVSEAPQVSPRKKRGRKPATEATVAMKRERRKVHHSHNIRAPHQSSSIVTMDFRPQLSESWKPKSYALSEDGDSEPVYISSEKSTPEPPTAPAPSAQVGIKRKRHHHGSLPGSGGGEHVKKQKRSSVESRTVSVTRVSVPVYDSSSAEEMDTSRGSSVCETSASSGHGLSSIKEEESIAHELRPRSLRVSLSIPDEVEPGTPFDKLMKVHHQRVTSVETKELPSWENFENSNLLHRTSSPKQRPQSLATEKSDIPFTKSNTVVKAAPEVVSTASSKNAPSAFLASPLPISSSPKPSHSPAAVVTTSSAPEADIKASVNGSSSFNVSVKLQGASSQSTNSPCPAAVNVGYSAPTLDPDVVVTTRPVVKAAQAEVTNITPSSQPPQSSPHQPSQPQAQPTNLPKPTSTSTAAPPGVTQASTASALSPTTKPAAFPSEPPAPSPNPPSGPVHVPLHVPKQQPHAQQQSVLVSHQNQPSPAPVAPKSTAQQVSVVQQQPTQQQQIPSVPQALKTPSIQQVSSVPVPAHQAVTVSATQSPSLARQQIMVPASSSRPPSVPVQQPVVVNPQVIVNSQRPSPSAPIQQRVLSRPSSNVSTVSQPHHQHQQQVYTTSTRPASIPGQQQKQQAAVVSAARPSSVPIQQHRPTSVPTQQQQTIVVAPPRPSSVPTQQVVQSRSQSQSPLTTPTQHMLVTYSQSGTPMQQIVVTQPPAYVGKGQWTTVFPASVSTPTSVLTHTSPANVQYSSPAVQIQRQVQEQSVATSKKSTVQSSGDADVIITGVESTNRGINQVPSVGYHTAVTQGGERIVILKTSSGEAIPYQTTTAMGPGTAGKVMAKTMDVAGQMAPPGSTLAPSLPTVSGQSQFVSTGVGNQTPAGSVVPVVLTPTNSAQLPMSTIASPVVYRVATDPQVVQAQAQVIAGATQVARGTRDTASVRTVPVNNNPASTRAAQVIAATSQSATPMIVACVPAPGSVSGQPFSGVSTTKPYAIVNAMPGTQIPATALPHPPKTYSLVSEKQTSGSTNKLQHREAVQTISKKIGDAFDSGNEQLLVAAFEDAWKRFQANGKQYESGIQFASSGTKVVHSKDAPPPNAEVFTVPGTTSRVSLVRQTSSNRMLTPKTSSSLPVQQVIAPPPLSSKEQTSGYVYTAATNAAQPQVYLQPVTAGQQQQQTLSHAKVHSSGLFYPPGSAENVAVLQKKAPGTSVQRVAVSQSTSSAVQHTSSAVQHTGSSSDGTVHENSESQATTHRRRSSKSKQCARCGKTATYLCSGCHTEWYCGRECQLKAWDTHAEHCKA